MEDPFASGPDEAQTEQPPVTPEESPFNEPPEEAPKKPAAKKTAPKKAPAKKAATDDDEEEPEFHPYTLSLKGHPGFDAPLLVIRGKTIGELADKLEGESGKDVARLMQNASRAAKYFGDQFPDQKPAQRGGGGGGNRQSDNGKPEGADEAPNGEKRYCAHGEMKFRGGVSKSSGKSYKGFFCTSRDRNDQCDAQFLKG